MNDINLNIIIGITFLMMGLFIARLFEKKRASGIIKTAKKEVSTMLKQAQIEGENIKIDKISKAKRKFLELKSEYEKIVISKESKIKDWQRRTKDKEKKVSQEFEHAQQLNRKLEKEQEIIKAKKQELDNVHSHHLEQLERVSNLSVEKAKKELINSLQEEAHTEALKQSLVIIEETKLNAQKEAKKIVIQSIQRIGTEESVENCVTTFNLESDDLKGKIIGREGRNIRVLEAVTGVEILVDDTPETIILSCFDPVRREIARLSLHKLVTDGRIHPARIEEVVAKTSKQIKEEIIEIGKRTAIDLGIHGLHPELIRIIGRMRYRSSYGQNLLQHSREVAKLCSVMAADLGLNPKLAKRAGLLHDIGKVAEEENELPHALLGMEWAKKYGEKPEILNAIGAHHDEIEMTDLLSPIVQVCDAISGARPGMRHQQADSYVQRLKDLESTALGFDGVQKAYAIQAGRELRVFVESEKINDQKISELSFNISSKIQKEMTYPGQVKVTVIRETRAVNIAT